MDLKKFIYYKCRAIKVYVLAFIAPRKLANYYYKNIFGRSINWKSPQDLNEWINVLMHSSDTSMWTLLADKYRVRQYIEKKGLSHILVPLLGVWNNPDKIEIDKLPDQFVIKSNNGNETVLLVDKNVYIPDLKSITKLWLREKFGRTQCEPHYFSR